MAKPSSRVPDLDDDATAARQWLAEIKRYYSDDENKRIAHACDLLLRCRAGQTLETGESRARHALETGELLVALRMESDTLIAGLLNGCLDAGGIDPETLREDFGPEVLGMLEDLARIEQISSVKATIKAKRRRQKREEQKHEESLRRLLLGIAEDVRVVLIVLAQRLHIMRVARHLEPEVREAIARDTQRVYAPLANRLGVWQVKWELEDLSLRFLDPQRYQEIAQLLAENRKTREGYIARVIKQLEAQFAKEKLPIEIKGRPKHIYSIYRKMQRKDVDLEGLYDLRAIRIMVDTVLQCYHALSIIHTLWQPIPEEFDDYIARPKGNMYRSLHTAVIGPEGKSLEVQIRTHEMHEHAEFGVAAHWAYKENQGHDAEFQRRVVWMRKWLDLKEEPESDEDFFERFKDEFHPVNIYVLTPLGKVVELPQGSTALDFAYAIHSEVGHRCQSATADDKIIQLTEPLKSGQTVRINTRKEPKPSRDWLDPHKGYLKTARARNRVRQWLNQQDFDEHVGKGRDMLERELERLAVSSRPDLERAQKRWNLKRPEDILAAIGRGDLAAGQVARQVTEQPSVEEPPPPSRPAPPQRQRSAKRGEILIEGVDDLMTKIATCCKPVPYEPIIGYLTRGRGVTVHRPNCKNITGLGDEDRARLIDVSWADQDADTTYPAELVIIAADRKALLRDITSIFADADINVIGTETQSNKHNDTAKMRIGFEVGDSADIRRITDKLQQLPEVFDVERSR